MTTDDTPASVLRFLEYPDPPRLYDTWFLTFRGDKRGLWVRIDAATRDEARAYVVKNYEHDEYDELLADVVFNPELFDSDGELAHVRVGPS